MNLYLKTGPSIVSNKHIVFITPGFAKNEADTTCITSLQLMARSLRDMGNRVSVIALHYPYTSERYKWHGIDVYPLGGENKSWKKGLLYGWAKKAFVRIDAENKVDILHAFWLNEATTITYKLSKRFGVPMIATSWGQDAKAENRKLNAISEMNIPIFTHCKSQTELLSKAGVDSRQLAYLGIDPIEPLVKNIDFIGVGNLTPLKNFKYFIEVADELRKLHPSFQAVIVGIGKEGIDLEWEIEHRKLEKHVKLVGQLSYIDTLKFIAKSRVLLQPSSYEGYGMTIVEALAAGTHIMAQSVGIAAELPELNLLSMDALKDANALRVLLQKESAEPRLISINETMEAYGRVYAERLI